jgi:hypothetical protein
MCTLIAHAWGSRNPWGGVSTLSSLIHLPTVCHVLKAEQYCGVWEMTHLAEMYLAVLWEMNLREEQGELMCILLV